MASISYSVSGSGFPIVFLHGFCESKDIWDDFSRKLSRTYKVISLDLPGFGESEALPHVTIETFAEAVYEHLRMLNIETFLLVGHSLGGYITLALAEKHPKAVKGLCLFNSSALPDSEEKKESRDKSIEFAQNNGVEAFIRPFVPPLFHASNRVKCHADMERLIDIGIHTPLKSITSTIKAMRDRPDRTHVLSEAKYPVLFIVGKNDNAIKLEDSLAQCHLAYESYVLFLEDAAHQGMFERKEQTLEMLSSFASIVFKK